jgi:hypothetical protein
VATLTRWPALPRAIGSGSRGNATAIIAAFATGYLERMTPQAPTAVAELGLNIEVARSRRFARVAPDSYSTPTAGLVRCASRAERLTSPPRNIPLGGYSIRASGPESTLSTPFAVGPINNR